MQEQLDKITAGATWLDEILTHEAFVSLALAIFGSWCITLFLLFLIRRYTSLEWRVFAVQSIDFVVAFVICATTWPGAHRWVWAPVIGAASPALYFGLTVGACWKWPGLRKFIRLKELAALDEAAVNVPSGESP